MKNKIEPPKPMDHAFLLEGGVFTQDALRPHPYEFFLYYDC